MAERRSMTQALAMSPEQVKFIRDADAPQTPVRSHTGDTERITDRADDAAAHSPAGSNPNAAETDPPSLTRRSLTSPEPLVPLTTRLRASTAEALRQAHLEQQLHRRAPATRQQIVEEALVEWLVSRGFLR